jgi:hypothetical protein
MPVRSPSRRSDGAPLVPAQSPTSSGGGDVGGDRGEGRLTGARVLSRQTSRWERR